MYLQIWIQNLRISVLDIKNFVPCATKFKEKEFLLSIYHPTIF